ILQHAYEMEAQLLDHRGVLLRFGTYLDAISDEIEPFRRIGLRRFDELLELRLIVRRRRGRADDALSPGIGRGGGLLRKIAQRGPAVTLAVEAERCSQPVDGGLTLVGNVLIAWNPEEARGDQPRKSGAVLLAGDADELSTECREAGIGHWCGRLDLD